MLVLPRKDGGIQGVNESVCKRSLDRAIDMPEDMTDLIVAALKVVNAIFSIWVNLGAAQPLTNDGSILVNNLAQVAVTMAHTAAQLAINNPIP